MANQTADSGDEDMTCAEINAHNARHASVIQALCIVLMVLCVIAVVTDVLSILVWREKATTASGFYLTILNVFKLCYAVFLLTATVLWLRRESVPPLALTIVRSLSGYAFFGTTFICLLMVIDRNNSIVLLLTNCPERLHRAKMTCAITATSLAPFSIGFLVVRATQGREDKSTLGYGQFLTIAFRLLPWLVILVYNLLLLKTLRAVQAKARQRFVNQFGTGITATVIASTFVSFLSYPAAQAYRLYNLFYHRHCVDDVAFHVIFILQIVDQPLHFALYLALVKKFRRELQRRIRLHPFASRIETHSPSLYPTGLMYAQSSMTDTTKAAYLSRGAPPGSRENPADRFFEATLPDERRPVRVLTSLPELQVQVPESAGQNNRCVLGPEAPDTTFCMPEINCEQLLPSPLRGERSKKSMEEYTPTGQSTEGESPSTGVLPL